MEKALTDIRDYEYLLHYPYIRQCFDGSGFDCWSLIHHIYQLNNIELPTYVLDGWSVRKTQKQIESKVADWEKVEYAERRFLDVILFHTSRKLSTHVGVTLNSKYYIHANKVINVAIEKFSSGFQSSRINRIYRWRQ